MTKKLAENEQIVVDFLKMLETRQSSSELEKFYHEDVEQVEYPNAILKNLAKRGLAELKEGSDKGRQILSKEKYNIKNMHSVGDTVILEAVWKGTVSVPIGNLNPGDQMTAYFAQFFEIKDGKIYRQRNYDCFEPFS